MRGFTLAALKADDKVGVMTVLVLRQCRVLLADVEPKCWNQTASDIFLYEQWIRELQCTRYV